MHPEFFRKPCAPFTPDVLRAAGVHAAQARPNEACGLVRGGRYVPCENVASDPVSAFEVAPAELARAYRAGDLQGVVHSHPGGPWHPSAADMAGQIATGVPWAIVVPGEAGAELACHWGGVRPPVFIQGGVHVSRAFLHGVSDCYTLVKDYFAEVRGVQLDEFPRDWEWWKEPQTAGGLYLDNLESQGFRVVSTSSAEYCRIARPGDAYLMSIRSKVPNHAGIYLGDGLLLEHMQGNLSHRQPIARLINHITHWLRRD